MKDNSRLPSPLSSPQLQPYVYNRDAYEVERSGPNPEIGFVDAEKPDPAGPEDEADYDEGYQGVNGQEQLRFPEKAPELGDSAKLDRRFAARHIISCHNQVHH